MSLSSINNNNLSNTIAIIDYGGQFTKVIDRRVRELGINTIILPKDYNALLLNNYGGLILSGSPDSVNANTITKNDYEIFKISKPILGICYGMQLMNYIFKGTIESKTIREDGQDIINIDIKQSKLFYKMNKNENVLLTHGDSIDKLGNDFIITAKSSKDIIVCIENHKMNYYGVQFHPEVDLTANGKQIFSNFLFHICNLTIDYKIEDREALAIKYIQDKVGNDNHVLVLVSGGVDSSVCAALLAKALPHNRIHCLHIDNGFMRKNESSLVINALQELGIKIHFINASDIFYSSYLNHCNTKPLNETILPENKRQIIGDTFMKIAENTIKSFNLDVNHTLLAQGTLRPDLIESAGFVSNSAQVIKTHHNDTNLVRTLRKTGRVLEPLFEYHKDEVRLLGESLGLPHSLVWRQPFPGPGLSVRCICSDGTFDIDNIKLNQQLLDKLHLNNLDLNITKTILPIRSVGVQGDGRTYGLVVGLSFLYTNIDDIPWDRLLLLAKEIPKLLHSINRVVFIFGDNSISNDSIHLIPTLMKKSILSQLQEADFITNSLLETNNLTKLISQMPVILIPLSFHKDKYDYRSIVLRPFITNDFMTGIPALPGSKNLPFKVLNDIVSQITSKVPKTSRVLLDLTCKPPGTTEWE